MTGEYNLSVLLASMAPTVTDTEYVFVSLPHGGYADCAHLQPFATVQEREGLTLVLTKKAADTHGVHYDSVFKCITLSVHSSLEAVGLTAAVSTALAKKGISANVMAGYYHDHIFVPTQLAQEALAALVEFS